MAIERGLVALININDTDVAGCSTSRLSINGEVIDISTMSDDVWDAYMAGPLNWEVSGEAMVDLTDGGLSAVETALLAQTAVTVKFPLNYASSTIRTGSGLVTNFTYNGTGRKGALSASFTIRGTGALATS